MLQDFWTWFTAKLSRFVVYNNLCQNALFTEKHEKFYFTCHVGMF